MPPRYVDMRQSWREKHPTWEHRLWDDASIRALLRQHHPTFLATYGSYRRLIQRVDAAKYFILYRHGGFYFDLDTRCRRPLDSLLHEYPHALLLLSEHPFSPTEERLLRLVLGTRHVLTNGTLASAAGLSLWQDVLAELPRAVGRFRFQRELNVTFSTGPAFLSRALDPHLRRADRRISVLPPEYFESKFGFDSEADYDPRSFIEHSHDATWQPAFLRAAFSKYFDVKRSLTRTARGRAR